ALLVAHGVAMEAGGDAVVHGRIREQVSGDLLDRELVEGHVGVEGVDDPVAVGPDLARAVLLVAVGIGVAGEVEPTAGPALAVVGAGEEAVDELLVGVGGGVFGESVGFLGRRRKADQV